MSDLIFYHDKGAIRLDQIAAISTIDYASDFDIVFKFIVNADVFGSDDLIWNFEQQADRDTAFEALMIEHCQSLQVKVL